MNPTVAPPGHECRLRSETLRAVPQIRDRDGVGGIHRMHWHPQAATQPLDQVHACRIPHPDATRIHETGHGECRSDQRAALHRPGRFFDHLQKLQFIANRQRRAAHHPTGRGHRCHSDGTQVLRVDNERHPCVPRHFE